MKYFIKIFFLTLFFQNICYSQQAEISGDLAQFSRGREIYIKNCSTCHGKTGEGNGPAARAIVNPKPRNFKAEQFKYGARIGQIIKTIKTGVPNTAMPPWSHLKDSDVEDVARYILKFKSK